MSGHFANLKIFPGFSNSADIPRDICGHIPLIDPECVLAFKQGIKHITLLDLVRCSICAERMFREVQDFFKLIYDYALFIRVITLVVWMITVHNYYDVVYFC